MAEYRILIERKMPKGSIYVPALAKPVFSTKEEAQQDVNFFIQVLREKDEGMYDPESYKGRAMPQHVAHKRLREWSEFMAK